MCHLHFQGSNERLLLYLRLKQQILPKCWYHLANYTRTLSKMLIPSAKLHSDTSKIMAPSATQQYTQHDIPKHNSCTIHRTVLLYCYCYFLKIQGTKLNSYPISISILSFHLYLYFQTSLFPSGFPTNCLGIPYFFQQCYSSNICNP
jgi:hypothetical protein